MKILKLFLVQALIGYTLALYKQKIDPFSFDTSYGEYPVSYKQFGSSVGLKSKMKLIQATNPVNGAIFLNQVPISFPLNYDFSRQEPLISKYYLTLILITSKKLLKAKINKGQQFGTFIINLDFLKTLAQYQVTRYDNHYECSLELIQWNRCLYFQRKGKLEAYGVFELRGEGCFI